MIISLGLRSWFKKLRETNPGQPKRKRPRLWFFLGIAAIASLLFVLFHTQSEDKSAVPPEIDVTSASLSLKQLISDARDAIIETPASAAHWGRLGMILLANERDVEAIPCFRQALLLSPDSFRWHYYLGLTTTSLDRVQAISSFTMACEVQPDDSVAHARLGELLFANGDVHGAGIHLEQALKKSRTPDPRQFQALARVRLLEGRIEEAGKLAGEAYRLAPDSRMVIEVLARIADREGNKDLAKEYLHRLQSLPDQPLPWIDPHAEQALILRRDSFRSTDEAIEMFANGDSDRAIQLLSAELANSPKNLTISLTLSQFYIQLQKLEDALDVLNRAIMIAPQSAEIRFRIGVVRFLQKDPGTAADSFRTALHLKPDHVLAMYNLGHCCLLQDDLQGAINAFQATLEMAPDQHLARLNLAKLQIKIGRTVEAKDHLNQILIAEPENIEARALLEQQRDRKE